MKLPHIAETHSPIEFSTKTREHRYKLALALAGVALLALGIDLAVSRPWQPHLVAPSQVKILLTKRKLCGASPSVNWLEDGTWLVWCTPPGIGGDLVGEKSFDLRVSDRGEYLSLRDILVHELRTAEEAKQEFVRRGICTDDFQGEVERLGDGLWHAVCRSPSGDFIYPGVMLSRHGVYVSSADLLD